MKHRILPAHAKEVGCQIHGIDRGLGIISGGATVEID